MTDSARKPRLRERRRIRAENSAARQQQHIAQRFAEAKTPLELLGKNYELLRGRLVQFERKALAAFERAGTEKERAAARDRLQQALAEIERVCGEASAEMARLTDQIHTERR